MNREKNCGKLVLIRCEQIKCVCITVQKAICYNGCFNEQEVGAALALFTTLCLIVYQFLR